MGHPPRNSLQPQESQRSDRDSEMHDSVTPKGGVSGDMGGIGPAKRALHPSPQREVAMVAAARQAQHHGCALARTQYLGPPERETNFRSAPEGLFWTLCSA